MGFTLRAALAELPDDAAITVAELVPAVVAWARGPMADVFAGCLDDPRASIRETDVAALIRSAAAQYDAILLDVDNGPEGLSRQANDGLYDSAGLAAARAALSPGGVLACGRRDLTASSRGGSSNPGSASTRSRCAPTETAGRGTSSGSPPTAQAGRADGRRSTLRLAAPDANPGFSVPAIHRPDTQDVGVIKLSQTNP